LQELIAFTILQYAFHPYFEKQKKKKNDFHYKINELSSPFLLKSLKSKNSLCFFKYDGKYCTFYFIAYISPFEKHI